MMIKLLLPLAAILFGLLAILMILQDVFEVLLLPRRVARSRRLATTILRPTWRLWRRAARRGDGYRPLVLASYGPLSIVILYIIWALCLIVAYGFCEWGLNADVPHPPSIDSCFYLSGSTFFTLGFGDVTPQSGLAKILAVAEAGNGFGLVAAVIGYLPVLYQSFSNREAHVIQLDARAGSPPSAAFMLIQHAGAMPELMDYLRHCENWTATVLEGQLSFPVLAFYRSHHDNQSWLAALCAMMDTCAVLLTGIAGATGVQPRMTFAMGRTVILEMMNILLLTPAEPPADRLPAEDFAHFTAVLDDADLRWAQPEAELRLRKLRSTYEPYIHAISQFLILQLPGWSPSPDPDHWQSGEHGGLARTLIDAERPVR